MSINVICPGCLKRFRVNEQFAGKQGPCPNCGEVISIPKESVTMHDTDATEQGKQKKRKQSIRPIPRSDLEFDPVPARNYALGVLGVLLLTFILGCIPMYATLRSVLGTLGLCLVAFPLTLFGYQALRDREQIFAFSGEELYRRSGIVAAGYVILWLGLELFLTAAQGNALICLLYLSAFAALATLLVYPLLEMAMPNSFLHCWLFGFAVVLLRFLLGLGWIWESSEWIRYTTAPPPLLPGM